MNWALLLSSLDSHLTALFGLSPVGWALGGFLLFLLAFAAFLDARTGRVPDPLLIFGALLSFVWHFALDGPSVAYWNLAFAALGGFALLAFNELYFRLRKHDGFGRGDAKWTAVAILAFGWQPALEAWLVGAWLALAWLGLRRFFDKTEETREGGPWAVRFLPFLFIGLLVGIGLL